MQRIEASVARFIHCLIDIVSLLIFGIERLRTPIPPSPLANLRVDPDSLIYSIGPAIFRAHPYRLSGQILRKY